MLRRTIQSIFVVSLLSTLSLTMAQAAQTAAAPAQDPAQAAAAQAVTAQAAAVQAAAQARAAQAAARKAAVTAAATAAGPAQVAAQTAATQAAAQAAAAQVAANQAATQAVAARQNALALANAERQAAATQALAARQQAAAQALAARQATAAQAAAARQQAAAAKTAPATPASTAIAKSVTSIPTTVAPAKPAATTPSAAANPSWQSAVSNILGSGSAAPPAAGAKPAATAGKSTGTGTTPTAAPTPAWETLVSNILTNGNSASASGKSGAPVKGGAPPDPTGETALASNSTPGGTPHSGNGAPQTGAAHGATSLAIPNVGLGMAESGNSMLTVLGCIRQGLQVACETELNNENKTETLMQSSAAWTDTLLIDDRGDRHERSMGFFLNIDGEQRTAIDVPYGQSARYILVFNDVPAKVTTVSLHSPTGGLNVVNIPLADPNADAAQTTSAAADPAAGAGAASGATPAAPAGKGKQAKNAKAAAPAATPN